MRVNGKARNSVLKLDLNSGIESDQPEMNVARLRHSSCELGDAIYVFCGMSQDWTVFNSIERLKISNSLP